MTDDSSRQLVNGMPVHVGDDGTIDRIIVGVPDHANYMGMLQWASALVREKKLHSFVPDYHRLQVEHFVFTALIPTPCDKAVLDIGAYDRRTWIGPGYRTAGLLEDGTAPDIVADLADDSFGRAVRQEQPDGWDVMICTEVLEHCRDPFDAVANMAGALKPGGLFLASSPFIWPDHRTDDYPDYWRITEQGWHVLLDPYFSLVQVWPCDWSRGGRNAYELMRQCEGMGFETEVRATTGYVVKAVR